MPQPDRVSSRVHIEALMLRFGSPAVTKLWWPIGMFLMVLLILLLVPKTVGAEDNYYQIINGSLGTVSDGYLKDRGYSVYLATLQPPPEQPLPE